jgi:hypothetical protein
VQPLISTLQNHYDVHCLLNCVVGMLKQCVTPDDIFKFSSVFFQPRNLENALIFRILPSLANNQANIQTKESIYVD